MDGVLAVEDRYYLVVNGLPSSQRKVLTQLQSALCRTHYHHPPPTNHSPVDALPFPLGFTYLHTYLYAFSRCRATYDVEYYYLKSVVGLLVLRTLVGKYLVHSVSCRLSRTAFFFDTFPSLVVV